MKRQTKTRNELVLDQMPKGEIVTDKRILSALKRKGLIFDYSPWGYLESVSVKIQHPDSISELTSYLFPNGNAPTYDNYDKKIYADGEMVFGEIEYKGHTFTTKYLDGCFNAYLQKTDGNERTAVHPRMSAWGAII
jgi:hypothetical protein